MGRNINISSMAARAGAKDVAHYAASKAGMVGMTKALAHEFGPAVITANTIPPRFISGTICLALRFSTSPLLRLPSAEVGQASKRLPALPMLNNDTSAYPL